MIGDHMSFIKTGLKVALTIGLLFFIAHKVFFFKNGILERMAATTAYPFLWTSSKVSATIKQYTDKKESYASLYAQHQKLKQDYADMLDQVIALQATQRHYDTIKELLDFKQRYHLDSSLIASVMVRVINPEEHYFLVNRGTKHGVRKDMIALHQFHIVGRVEQAYDAYSKVILITDQRSKVSAYTNKTKAPGIIRGQNNPHKFHLTYVSHLFTIEDGDIIQSSGQGLIFPEGFCLGRIVMHSLKDKELYHYIEVKPLINMSTIESCILADYASVNTLFASPQKDTSQA